MSYLMDSDFFSLEQCKASREEHCGDASFLSKKYDYNHHLKLRYNTSNVGDSALETSPF